MAIRSLDEAYHLLENTLRQFKNEQESNRICWPKLDLSRVRFLSKLYSGHSNRILRIVIVHAQLVYLVDKKE